MKAKGITLNFFVGPRRLPVPKMSLKGVGALGFHVRFESASRRLAIEPINSWRSTHEVCSFFRLCSLGCLPAESLFQVCETNDDCAGECRNGRCVDNAGPLDGISGEGQRKCGLGCRTVVPGKKQRIVNGKMMDYFGWRRRSDERRG